jgi:phosphoglycolate phosphatase
VKESPAIRAVLFDKDGTLFDFFKTWMPLYAELAGRLVGRDEARIARMLRASGYDPETGQLDPGSPLAAGSNRSIAEAWLIELPGVDLDELTRRMDAQFGESLSTNPVPVTDLAALFGRLKRRGLKLGVATMDSHAAATAAVEAFELVGLVDFVAGYDSGHGMKPGPGMVHAFCRAIEVPAVAVAVVGDTPHDMEMARAAGAGLAIGVLTGAAARAVLAERADHVLDSIAHLEEVI